MGWIRPTVVWRMGRGIAAIVVIAVVWGTVGLVGAAQLRSSRELSSLVGSCLALVSAWAVSRLIVDGHITRLRALRDRGR
ncbi:MAG: hypothetical protein Q4B98_06325 [Cutibacterium sp.]|nr:hypothetical protein [Cutibacterium sp.]MDO4412649.1 hypothetical protein [Cutibacterium sp.]